MSRDLAQITWLDAKGETIACVEKLKVLAESLTEMRAMAADALADAVLMGCREADVRQVLRDIVDELEPPFPGRR